MTGKEISFYGAATIGDRGQVAVPAALRRDLGLKPRDQVIFVRRDGDLAGFLVCLPEHALQGVLPSRLSPLTVVAAPQTGQPVHASLIEQVQGIDLFAGLALPVQEYVASLLKVESYERGELIVRQGEPCKALYCLVSGRMKRFKISPDGKEQILKILLPGDSFNEVPILDGGPNPASTEALEDSVVYALERVEFMRALEQAPALALGVIQTLSSRLRHLVGLVEDLSLRTTIGRVARLLLEQAEMTGRLTQQEMASMVGTVREVVGRALHELEQMGAISLDRGKITIVDAVLLQRLR